MISGESCSCSSYLSIVGPRLYELANLGTAPRGWGRRSRYCEATARQQPRTQTVLWQEPYPMGRAIIMICDMQYVPGCANVICDMQIRYGPHECDTQYANTLWAARMRYANMRIRYGLREYDMRYANRLHAMSNCEVAFSATIACIRQLDQMSSVRLQEDTSTRRNSREHELCSKTRENTSGDILLRSHRVAQLQLWDQVMKTLTLNYANGTNIFDNHFYHSFWYFSVYVLENSSRIMVSTWIVLRVFSLYWKQAIWKLNAYCSQTNEVAISGSWVWLQKKPVKHGMEWNMDKTAISI